MKLIKELGVIKVPSKNRECNYYREALFYCPVCDKEVVRRKRSGLMSKTCGCLRVGDHGKRLYNIWRSMKGRCNNNNAKEYNHYGGRGIVYCLGWEHYINFKNWAMNNGYSDGLTIDRIDTNGNYDPSNCRFVTRAVNVQNRRCVKLNPQKVREIRKLFNTGEATRQEIAKKYDVSWSTIAIVTAGVGWANIR